MKKILTLLLPLLLLCGCQTNTTSVKSSDHTQGKSIEPIRYDYNDATRTLTILSFGNSDEFWQTYEYQELESIEHPENVVISNGITAIPDNFFCYALEGNSGEELNHFDRIKNVTLPDTITQIGEDAFGNCSGLESVTIPDSVKKLGALAFEECKNLKSVKIGKGIESLKYGVFERCEKLSTVVWEEGLTTIGENAFVECSSLQSLKLPESVDTIGSGAFSGCTALSSVTLPEQLRTVKDYAFWACPKLKSVTVPGNVKTIGDYAFGYIINSDYDDVPQKDFVMKGKSGTAAEAYAKKNSFQFEVI